MNGTVIDIPGITVSVTPIELQDSTDVAHVVTIKDNEKQLELTITYGNINEIRSSKHQ